MKRILIIIEYFYTYIYLRYVSDKYLPDYKLKKINLVTSIKSTEHTLAITININALILECLFLNSHANIPVSNRIMNGENHPLQQRNTAWYPQGRLRSYGCSPKITACDVIKNKRKQHDHNKPL